MELQECVRSASINGLGDSRLYGPVAQWLEQGTHNPLVGGSNPSWPIIEYPLEVGVVAYWRRLGRQ